MSHENSPIQFRNRELKVLISFSWTASLLFIFIRGYFISLLVQLFLKSLPADCYFNIVGFGSHYAALFPEGSMKYDGESLQQAMNYANSMQADMGGTEIVEPLKSIYDTKPRDGYKRQVIVLTDGEVSWLHKNTIQAGPIKDALI